MTFLVLLTIKIDRQTITSDVLTIKRATFFTFESDILTTKSEVFTFESDVLTIKIDALTIKRDVFTF